MSEPIYYLTRADRDKLNRLLAMIDGAGGLDISPDGISVPQGGASAKRGGRGERGFWAEITGSTAIAGEDNRWRYAWKRVTRTDEGWADATAPHNFTGSTSSKWAINAAEASNDDAGVQGNGVDLDDDLNPELQAISGNPVVWMVTGIDDAGDPCFTFDKNNAVVYSPDVDDTARLTAWRYDATTHKFQVKTKAWLAAESGWTNVTDGSQPVAHTLVDDVTYDTSTHRLEQDKRTDMYLLEAGANSDNNLVNEAEACDGT